MINALTPNFSLAEFTCHDGTGVPPGLLANVRRLASQLQIIRDHIGKPITINSGYRTQQYNAVIRGAKNSQHVSARAADIVVAGLSPAQLHNAICRLIVDGKLHDGGVGLYRTFVHYDVRPDPARWFG